MKKIGIICLAVLLALGALGVGYAKWFDTLNIQGTVETGELDWEFVANSFNQKDVGLDWTGDLMASPVLTQLDKDVGSTTGAFSDTFFFKHLYPSVTRNFESIQQKYIEAFRHATPLFDNRNPGESQLDADQFIESYFWNHWGEAVMAMTYEGHFYRRITDNAYITPQDYEELGKGLAVALIEYFDLPSLPIGA